ncbi:MAG: hypothetical protein ABI318_17235 [Chthoniobacteraceae bacterium]
MNSAESDTRFPKNLSSGEQAPIHEFTPPDGGDGHDWLLMHRWCREITDSHFTRFMSFSDKEKVVRDV